MAWLWNARSVYGKQPLFAYKLSAVLIRHATRCHITTPQPVWMSGCCCAKPPWPLHARSSFDYPNTLHGELQLLRARAWGIAVQYCRLCTLHSRGIHRRAAAPSLLERPRRAGTSANERRLDLSIAQLGSYARKCGAHTTQTTGRRAPDATHAKPRTRLGGEDAVAADGADLLLRQGGEELGLHHHGLLGQLALAQDLADAVLGHVDDGGRALVLGSLLAGLFDRERGARACTWGRKRLATVITISVGLYGMCANRTQAEGDCGHQRP